MYFTRRKRYIREDLASTIRIENYSVEIQKKTIRVLGVQLDLELIQKKYVTRATRKSLVASKAMARLVISIQGPSIKSSRLLYVAIVRSTILYEAQKQSIRAIGESLAIYLLRLLQALQNSYLRKIIESYKRTSRKILERKTYVSLIDLYLEATRYRYANRIKVDQVEAYIASTVDVVWKSIRRARVSQIRPRLVREIVALQIQIKIEIARAIERLR